MKIVSAFCVTRRVRLTRPSRFDRFHRPGRRLPGLRDRVSVFAALALLLASPCARALENQLRDHPSPYLAMHGSDPVAWQEWSADTLELARREGRLLFVSSGYFACHWCHVMQRESYQSPESAAVLNAHFVPVKIDRELRPALDAYFIDFVERTQGQGGWPLNVILTPGGYPLVGFTYLPRDRFIDVMRQIQVLWDTDRPRMEELAENAFRDSGRPVRQAKAQVDPPSPMDLAARLSAEALDLADEMQGGFGDQLRFPMAPQLSALLSALEIRDDERLRHFMILTLDQMGAKGLRDHLGGGFFRYTVDPDWHTPHYEKMLYTNALLTPLYLRAASVLGRPDFKSLAEETLDFMLRDMAGADGAFVASLSALDDRGVEGGYYLWTTDRLKQVLTEGERRVATMVWGFEGAAAQEAGFLPLVVVPPEQAASELGLARPEADALLAAAKGKLLRQRRTRVLPRDQKQLAAWNGLALSALAAGIRDVGKKRYHEAGERLRLYIVNRLWDGERLVRALGGRGVLGTAALEDYAYVAAGLLDWADATGSAADRELAGRIVRQGWQRFYGAEGWRQGENLLIPGVGGEDAIADGPMPSPSGLMIEVSRRLAESAEDPALTALVDEATRTSISVLEAEAFWHATHARVLFSAGKASTDQPER